VSLETQLKAELANHKPPKNTLLILSEYARDPEFADMALALARKYLAETSKQFRTYSLPDKAAIGRAWGAVLTRISYSENKEANSRPAVAEEGLLFVRAS
jgi:hypothetical protein